MEGYKTAIIGIGATGSVLAAALLAQDPDTVCIDTRPGLGNALQKNGISITGVLNFSVPVKHFSPRIQDLKDIRPDIIFISTKTYHLSNVLKKIKTIYKPGMKIVSTHNGLGPEDVIADEFGNNSALRMSLNLGASIKSLNQTHLEFFDKPNYIGCLNAANKEIGSKIAASFTAGGLDTEFVDDIKLYVWRKMISKCSNASLCAVTDRTIKEVLDNPYTGEIARACYREALAVARAMGYDIDEHYLNDIIKHMEVAGVHKDSMCYDVSNKLPTEIDFLGGKIVEYGHAKRVPVPFFEVMTNLVRALEESYKDK